MNTLEALGAPGSARASGRAGAPRPLVSWHISQHLPPGLVVWFAVIRLQIACFFRGLRLPRCRGSVLKTKPPTKRGLQSAAGPSKSWSEFPSAVLSIWFGFCQHWTGRKTASVTMCHSHTGALDTLEIRTLSLPQNPNSLCILDVLGSRDSGGWNINHAKRNPRSSHVSLPELSAPRGKEVPTAYLIGTSFCGTLSETRLRWNRGFVAGGSGSLETLLDTGLSSAREMHERLGICRSMLESRISHRRSPLAVGGATSTGSELSEPATCSAQEKSRCVNLCGTLDFIDVPPEREPDPTKASRGSCRAIGNILRSLGFDSACWTKKPSGFETNRPSDHE